MSKLDLALFGGPKTRATPMPGRMAFGDEELALIQEVFAAYKEKGIDFGYQGIFEQRYTDAFVAALGGEGYADAVSTGTASLFVALAALRLAPGDHVLVSPCTDPGTLNAIVLNQLVPVLVDTMPGTFNVGPEQIAARIGPKAKAVVVVHFAGQAAPIAEIAALCREKKLLLMEDCSHAHGATYHGKKVGTFGDIAAFSTMYRKNHSTGGCGGVVYTRDLDRYHLVRAAADRGKPYWKEGFDEKDPSQFLFPALNFNQDEVSCAIGLASLAKLPGVIARRLRFLELLDAGLKAAGLKACSLAPFTRNDSPFFAIVRVDASRISVPVADFAKAVGAEGIGVNPRYAYLAEEWTYLKPYLADAFHCGNVLAARDGSFNVLFHERHGEAEVADVVAAIAKVEAAYLK